MSMGFRLCGLALVLSVAMSPDGREVACGGNTVNRSIYLFDRFTGMMFHRIRNFPGSVYDLAYLS